MIAFYYKTALCNPRRQQYSVAINDINCIMLDEAMDSIRGRKATGEHRKDEQINHVSYAVKLDQLPHGVVWLYGSFDPL